MAACSLVIGRLFACVGYDILCTMTGSGSKCYVNVLSCALLSTSLGCFLRKVIEALFLAAGGFDGFVVGLDDVCFVDDAG